MLTRTTPLVLERQFLFDSLCCSQSMWLQLVVICCHLLVKQCNSLDGPPGFDEFLPQPEVFYTKFRNDLGIIHSI